MAIQFDTLEVGRTYDRPYLAALWGYQSHHAFSRGVFTPRDANVIVLFVTKEKQNSQTQYNDFIDGEYLFWEGEEKHASDQRIVGARAAGTPIQLFYRDMHHTPFVYFGEIGLVDCVERIDKPSEFLFSLHVFVPAVSISSSHGSAGVVCNTNRNVNFYSRTKKHVQDNATALFCGLRHVTCYHHANSLLKTSCHLSRCLLDLLGYSSSGVVVAERSQITRRRTWIRGLPCRMITNSSCSKPYSAWPWRC
jgi:hypothetical protein